MVIYKSLHNTQIGFLIEICYNIYVWRQNFLGDRVKKIVLYRSYARGDFYEGSDIDIMILTDLSDAKIIEEREKVICNSVIKNKCLDTCFFA